MSLYLPIREPVRLPVRYPITELRRDAESVAPGPPPPPLATTTAWWHAETDDQLVGSGWTDASGNGNDLVQMLVGQRPVWNAGGWADFDGNDWMSRVAGWNSQPITGQPYIWGALLYLTGSTATQRIADGTTSGGRCACGTAGTSVWNMFAGSNFNTNLSAAPGGQWAAVCWLYEGGGPTCYVIEDGVQSNQGNAGTQFPAGPTIGSDWNQANFLTGRLRHVVVGPSTGADAAERLVEAQALNTYLTSRIPT